MALTKTASGGCGFMPSENASRSMRYVNGMTEDWSVVQKGKAWGADGRTSVLGELHRSPELCVSPQGIVGHGKTEEHRVFILFQSVYIDRGLLFSLRGE